MIYNRKILKSILHVLDYYGESIRFDIDRLEEALSDENQYLVEESYLFVQAMRLGLYDAIIFDEDADRYGYIHYLIEEHQFSEKDAVFMLAICLYTIRQMGYYFEIPELSKMLEDSYKHNDKAQLSIIARTYFDGFGVKQDYEKAFEIYSYLYSIQDECGASYLGYMYEYGLGVEQDLEKAYMYYSNTKDDLCYYYLGLMYMHGKYVEVDYEKALECFLHSEYDDAYMYQGMLLEGKKDYAKAFLSYHKGAMRFQEECLYKTAQCLQYGIGVDKNIEEAKKYYEYGYYFDQGDCGYNLAMMMLENKENERHAISLLKHSVELYNQQACLTLAKFYEFGYYVDKDLNQSLSYYKKADKIARYINKKIKEGIKE